MPRPDNWEAPDHLPVSQRKFLVERAERINDIVSIAYFKAGQILLQVERKFKSDPELSDWFPRWVAECTPFSYAKARSLIAIVKTAEKDPRVMELSNSLPYATLSEISSLPEKVRNEFIQVAAEGQTVRQADVNAVRKTPEFEVAKLEELVMNVQAQLFSMRTAAPAADARQRSRDKESLKNKEKQLHAYLEKLAEAKAKIASQDKILSMQQIVLNQLQKQLKERELRLEEITLDPNAKRNRDMARTIVDATKGLDLLLSTLDRYATDKPDLGPEAIRAIERKLDLVKEKLSKHYGTA